MRRTILVIAIALGPSCGGEPGASRAELDALLQRLDAMDRRLDQLEESKPATAAHDDANPFMPEIALPEPIAPGSVPTTPATLEVRLTVTGVELDGKTTAYSDVLARFRSVALAAPDTRLVVVSEPDVPHASVVDVLDLAREAGLDDIAMSARIYGEGGGGGGEGEGAITAGR